MYRNLKNEILVKNTIFACVPSKDLCLSRDGRTVPETY